MSLTSRLDPAKYIGYAKPNAKVKETFGDQFRTDANASIGGQYPWDPGRPTEVDILNRAQARKRTLNAKLGYVDPEEPLDTKLFIGTERFVRHENYDFKVGRALTTHRPQDNPDFNPIWLDAYRISPTIPPNKRAKNPMPTASNPDPHGYIMQMAQQQAENTVNPEPTVAGLLSKSKVPELPAATEEDNQAT